LEYLPEFLITHLITEFKIAKQCDDDIDPTEEDVANEQWDRTKS